MKIQEITLNDKTIRVGETYNIYDPNNGFSPIVITEGKIEVLEIADYEDVVEDYVDPFILSELYPDVVNAKWIVYKDELGLVFAVDDETFYQNLR